MSGESVYVDESKRAGYTVAAVAVVAGSEHAAVERALRGLLLPGQRSIHFKNESEGRKRTILAAMADLAGAGAVSGMVYERATGPHVPARRACLEALSADHAKAGQIVLDMSEGDRAADEKTLREARARLAGAFGFRHEEPHRCPGLWLPDALAWAWTHGGTWRQLAKPMITSVQQV